jgi:hypothetical protein
MQSPIAWAPNHVDLKPKSRALQVWQVDLDGGEGAHGDSWPQSGTILEGKDVYSGASALSSARGSKTTYYWWAVSRLPPNQPPILHKFQLILMACPIWGCPTHLQKKQTKEGEHERRPTAQTPCMVFSMFLKAQGAWSMHLQALRSTPRLQDRARLNPGTGPTSLRKRM